jgi:hypothetical protein
MFVRLLTALATPSRALDEGEIYECDDATAQRMFARGIAVPYAVSGIELAVVPDAPERAVTVDRRRRRV